MKFHEAVCIRHWLNLRRERDARACDDAEKIGARLKMCAARDPKQQGDQGKKTLHAGYFLESGRNGKPFNLR